MIVLPVISFLILHTASANTTSPQCLEGALNTWCMADQTQDLAEAYYECKKKFSVQEKRCRKNEQGRLCGLIVDHVEELKQAEVACFNQSEYCSAQCYQLLQQLKDKLGCCLNEMINTTTGGGLKLHGSIVEYELWKNCSLDLPPKSCQPSPLATISAPKVTRTQKCSSHELFRERYKVQCSNTTIQALAYGFDKQSCNQVSRDLINTCTITKWGVWCVEKFFKMLPEIRKPLESIQSYCSGAGCPRACRKALRKLKDKLGCCVNYIFNNSFFKLIYSNTAYLGRLTIKSGAWSSCELPPPKVCKLRIYNGGASSIHAITFIMVMAITVTYINY